MSASTQGPSVLVYSILAKLGATLFSLDGSSTCRRSVYRFVDDREIIGRQREGTGPGQREVRTMANPPTCFMCGSILTGYGLSKELNFPVHFCTICAAKASPKSEGKKEAA